MMILLVLLGCLYGAIGMIFAAVMTIRISNRSWRYPAYFVLHMLVWPFEIVPLIVRNSMDLSR